MAPFLLQFTKMQCTLANRANVFLLICFLVGFPGHPRVWGQGHIPVKRGLLVRYAFDNNLIDSMPGRNNLSGTATYTADRNLVSNHALTCTGTTQGTAGFSMSIARDFAASCWINPSTLPVGQQLHALLSIEAGLGLYFNLGLSGDSGVGFRFTAGGIDQPFVNFRPTSSYADQWMHVAVSRANTKLKLYINGVLKDSAATGSSLVDGLSNPLLVGGSSLLSSFGFGGFFIGTMDELRIYNRPLTQAEVDTLADHLTVGTRPKYQPLHTELWVKSDFVRHYPEAVLTSVSGATTSAFEAVPGLYIWQIGANRRRILLQ
jgi:hypothetical protein